MCIQEIIRIGIFGLIPPQVFCQAVFRDYTIPISSQVSKDFKFFFGQFSRLNRLIDYLNRTCYLGIRDMEFHFANYPKGSFYKRHLDVFTTDSSRKLSAICYLNPDWKAADGGQLRLYLTDGEGSETAQDVLPQAGRLVIFNSQKIEHEVIPTNRERYSITGWLKDRESLI